MWCASQSAIPVCTCVQEIRAKAGTGEDYAMDPVPLHRFMTSRAALQLMERFLNSNCHGWNILEDPANGSYNTHHKAVKVWFNSTT